MPNIVPNTDPSALFSGDFWTGFAQTPTPTPVIVTYSFPTSLPPSDSSVPNFTAATDASFKAFSPAEQAQAIAAMGEWAAASGLVFVQVAPGKGDINFSNVDFTTLATPSTDAGIGYNPFGNWNGASAPNFTTDLTYAGDVFMNTQYQNADGTVSYATMLHEIGHAIGLKHPTQVDDDAATGINEDNVLSADDPSITIMSTLVDAGDITDPHLLPLDQAAAAAIYGPAGTGEVVTATTGIVTGSNSVSNWSWNADTQTLTQTAATANDTIHGTSVNDVINAGDGTDYLFGLDGTNILNGGTLKSSVDYFYGGPDSDTMNGGALGTNYFYGGTGTEVMNGGAGTNTFTGGGGVDTMNGGAGTNIFMGSTGTETMTGGTGTNTFTDGGGTDLMDGRAGTTNTFNGGTGTETMKGGTGTNTFYDGAGTATIVAQGVTDTFNVSNPNTTITESTSTASNPTSSSTIYTSVSYTMPKNVDTMTLEASGLTGTANNDASVSLFGYRGGDSTLIAGSGFDYMAGGAGGANTLVAGSGGDSLFGGGGAANIFVFNSAADSAVDNNAYIGDFREGTDKIELSGIAQTLGKSLTFIGSGPFTHQAGQVETTSDGTYNYIEVDTTGSGTADFEIQIYDNQVALLASDLILSETPCYCAGTRILTERGEVAVEDLSIGDRVVTVGGSARPIKWIGTRSYAGPFARLNRKILPVCFKAGSLADETPKRDLWVSPNHAMFIDDILIPAGALVNGDSIARAGAVEEVRYFHVELESHDVILAEGAWAETFVDDDSRMLFHNAADYFKRYRVDSGPTQFCAPRVSEGFELEAIRQRLGKRSGSLHKSDSVPVGNQGIIDRLGGMA